MALRDGPLHGPHTHTVTYNSDQEFELDVALARVRVTRAGDSNDGEIEALNEALDQALVMLDFSWPPMIPDCDVEGGDEDGEDQQAGVDV